MDHYFTNNPSVKSNPKIIKFEISSHTFIFNTDNGVFCKNYLDLGTEAFLKVLLKKEIIGRNLDVGCGYGPIGAVLGYFNPSATFILSDINTRACALASENINSLGLKNCKVVVSDIYESIEGTFDNIFINPPIRAGKKIIYQMFEKAYGLLNEKGSLYIVIRKDQGSESAQKFIEGIFGNCQLLKRDKGYYIYQAIKNDTIKNL